MPNIMIHERVGDYIGKKLNIESYDYYLGLLAPDSPNVDGFAPKEERWMAHQRRKDYDEWRESATKFYKEQKDYYPKDFILGYYIHIITDIVYDDYLYLDVRERIKEEYPEDKAHDIMRKDMTEYYFKGIDKIKKILEENNKSYDILNISEKVLLRWKNENIKIFKTENNTKYLTEEDLHFLEEQVYKEVVEKLEL